jgi:signal transduction histidine kinase
VEATGPARPSSAAGLLEAKLGLAEFLLACDESMECARRSLDWLAEYAGLRRGAFLMVDGEHNRLAPLATHRVDLDKSRHAPELDDHTHPLVAALLGGRPVTLDESRAEHPSSPMGRASFLAVACYGSLGKEVVPAGLLLVSPASGAVQELAAWLAPLLGQRMARAGRIRTGAEAERRSRRERLLLDAVPDPIILTDADGRMVIANARAQALLATTEGESEGRRRAVALNNMLLSSALAQSAIQEGGRRELLLVDPVEGSDLLFELLTTVAVDTREGTGLVSVLRNVSDLHRATEEIEDNYRRVRAAEADVRAERDRLDLVIDSVADPIIVTDSGGALVMMNAPAERLFTIAREVGPEEDMRIRANDAHFSSFLSNLFFAADQSRWKGEVGLVDPQTGQALPVEAVSGKILSEHGEVTAIVTVLHDRTEAMERARLYEELKKASAQLEERVREATAELVSQNERLRRQRLEVEQASQAKSQFLANMSHEFRTPLNAILGYTSLLLQGVSGPMSPQQEKNLTRVDSNARHLLAIINDILDISRIEAGKMPLHVSRFALPALVSEVLAELDPLIARSRLSVKTDLGRKVPEISTDRAKVKQVVLNLVSNAIKFTPSGLVTVSLRHHPDTREVAVAVRDTGIGIATGDQERVFEDFRQADNSPAREYGGAGLGLAICRRLAHMLDGRIDLSSRVGQGSTFTLVLPSRRKK